MSNLAVEWAEETAPVASAYERLLLIFLAARANSDGTDAYPGKPRMARVALCDEKTVQRHLKGLFDRGLIAIGDQEAARKIPKRYRPTVYDVMIPYSWYSEPQLQKVNKERAERGLPPLTPEMRPELASPPPKTAREDKGKPRPQRRKASAKAKTSDNNQGGLQDPSLDNQEGGLSVPPRGDSQSSLRGDSETPKSVRSVNPSGEPVRPEDGTPEPDGRTEERSEAEDKPPEPTSEDAAARAEVLMSEDRAKALIKRQQLGTLYKHQKVNIRDSLAVLLESTGDERLVRGHWQAKLAQARTWKFVIEGVTNYAGDVYSAEPVLSPDEQHQKRRQLDQESSAPRRIGRKTATEMKPSPVEWLTNTQFSDLGPQDRAHVTAHGNTPDSDLPEVARGRLDDIRRRVGVDECAPKVS